VTDAYELGGTAMTDYSERRRHSRVSSKLNVRISTIEPERDPWTGRPFFRATQERCANVSRGGAFIDTAEPLSPGRRLLLEFHLPDGRQLEAIGRVAWSRKIMSPRERDADAGIGVEFLGGSPAHFSELEQYIKGKMESTDASRAES
jgi:Tfp pilus assembly protein PilZ